MASCRPVRNGRRPSRPSRWGARAPSRPGRGTARPPEFRAPSRRYRTDARSGRIWWANATREATVERALHRGRDVRAVHRMFGLRHRLPLRRPRVRRRRRALQALSRPGRRGDRQLHPRREGMHPVHPGLSPLSHLGARHREPPVRTPADRRRGRRASPAAPCWPGPPTSRCRASARMAASSPPS